MAALTLQEADALVQAALIQSGASAAMAASVAKALVLAEAQGIASHGLSRVPQYATHLKNGRANGQAVATIAQRKGAALVIDAGQGLAFPACDLAVAEGIKTAKELGVSFIGVKNSHHAGVMVDHLRAAANAGHACGGRKASSVWHEPDCSDFSKTQ
jgi:(2R)-3-sulfolactate dehydrogenase (NADP+)